MAGKIEKIRSGIAICLFLFAGMVSSAPKAPKPELPLYMRPDGKLAYHLYERGNRIPDFSFCGYAQSEKDIPDVPVKVIVRSKEGDATQRIQAAIDYVGKLPADASGFRGAVLLGKGKFEVKGGLVFRNSGVVLRGSGMGDDGTTVVGTGEDRETLIRICGTDDRTLSDSCMVTDNTVPVNATKFHVKGGVFKTGDIICITRPSTKEWIDATGTEYFGGGISTLGWKPGNIDISWERKVLKVYGDEITVDVPLTTELDSRYGGARVSIQKWPGRICFCGIENMRLVSSYDESDPKDENHRWEAITIENAGDSWVRRIEFRNFAASAVYALASTKQITVEDCKSFHPVSEIGGYRRYTFYNEGQMNLFQRLYAEYGFHDFAVGPCTAGPNAFVQCHSYLPYSFSGAIGSWASGILFDMVNVDGNAMCFNNRWQDGQGAGWSAANSVFWQCNAAMIECFSPPTAMNWAFGVWSQFKGDGSWTSSNEHIEPLSLYCEQLAERLGKKADISKFLSLRGNETSSPSIEEAKELSDDARHPQRQLNEWIDSLAVRYPIPLDSKGAREIENIKTADKSSLKEAPEMSVKNGWIVRGDKVLTGRRQIIDYWNGNLKKAFTSTSAHPHITRWVPGMTGKGFTDDLDSMTDGMVKNQVVAMDHHYGLWYDRRRDDHERIRRMDGDVWAPFYEQPFARSGQGTAWDGLSKYDLTKWNYWYWNRLKEYADLADQKGLLLFNENFFQHNIIEAGAHWVDCPWRTANNINNTEFPEPVNFAGDKRLFLAEQFYDLSNTVRKNLYRNYIRKCLENFKENNGVIQFISDEYTGPLEFVQFWLDVIGEWEKETGKDVIVGLSTTKDVQDAILKDPVRSKLVKVIDTKYWKYMPDGRLYAPAGGVSLAVRQHERLISKGIVERAGDPPSARASRVKGPAEAMYWSVRDYRNSYPDKAVIFESSTAFVGWPAFMAGGSVCSLPSGLPSGFLESAVSMKPMDAPEGEDCWVLGDLKKGYIVYLKSGGTLKLDLSAATGKFRGVWIDSATGKRLGKEISVKGGSIFISKAPEVNGVILWLYR